MLREDKLFWNIPDSYYDEPDWGDSEEENEEDWIDIDNEIEERLIENN